MDLRRTEFRNARVMGRRAHPRSLSRAKFFRFSKREFEAGSPAIEASSFGAVRHCVGFDSVFSVPHGLQVGVVVAVETVLGVL